MKKVVVVEDEDLVRRGIVLAVDWQSVDCEVVGEAANGAQGLEVIRAQRPDLIVTDIKMPILDGLEMVETLRREGNGARVIILTAYSDFDYARSALKLGAVDYLLKPFHDGELEAAVERLVSRERTVELPGLTLPEGPRSNYVTATLRYIAGHYGDPDMSVGTVADSLEISEGHLSHVFKKETGHTLNTYLTAYRMGRAMELLKDCRAKVYEVAQQVGYQDVTYFSTTFKRLTGLTPSEYQKQAG